MKKCLVHDESKICLISIPKNATTYFRLKYKMKYVDYKHLNYTKILILRDPEERLWSAYCQIMKDPKYNFTDIHDMFQHMETHGYFDIHLQPQYRFLECKNLKVSDIDIIFTDIEEADKYFESKIKNIYPTKKNKNNIPKNIKISNTLLKKFYQQDFII